MTKNIKLLVSASLLVLATTGCSVTKVESWERGYLARPEMNWDPDPLTASFRSHVYFSKEASSGGGGVGGTGCGCN